MQLLLVALTACATDPVEKGGCTFPATDGLPPEETGAPPVETTCADGTASLQLTIVNIVGDTPLEEEHLDLQYDVAVTVDGEPFYDAHRTERSFRLDVPAGLVEVELTNGAYMDDVTTSGGSGAYGLNGTCYYLCTGSGTVEVCGGDEAAVDVPLECPYRSSCD